MSRKPGLGVAAFLQDIASLPKGPGVCLDDALQPTLAYEANLRQIFAVDRTSDHIRDLHVGLVDLFEAPIEARTTRARVVKDEEDLSAKYVMQVPSEHRRAEGAPATVSDLNEFKKNWSVFSENSLSQLSDWSNVVAAGGSVLACVAPLPDHAKESKRETRKYYHSSDAYAASDVDLFLYGMTPAEAEKKIQTIYEAVRDSVPWEVTCVRTKHTVSIHSQYPYRTIQIVLRLYHSPAEVLAGFDVDAPCCAFDGERVWASPRAVVAMMRQCNTVDVTRRSPSYEARLAKYAARGFEVYVPTLRRSDIDPNIFERLPTQISGLARLLVLEQINSQEKHMGYLHSRRELRGRPKSGKYPGSQRRSRRQYKGDLKVDASLIGLEQSSYEVRASHIPYGPGWHAQRIEKLVYNNDLKMNSNKNINNADRRLHRHPAFFGTGKECLEDCCEYCPEPMNDEEKALRATEDEVYVRGRISFIQENPGRQSISGSFNPINTGEWSEQTYITQSMRLLTAIVSRDIEAVSRMIQEGANVNDRDHAGRTPLHVAIIAKSFDVACALIDAGALIATRLADGRTALHLAAQAGDAAVVQKLLERSAYNLEAKRDKSGAPNPTSAGSDDDGWSDVDSSDSPTLKSTSGLFADAIDLGSDLNNKISSPDVLDLNSPDGDLAFTPLHYAITSGSPVVVKVLLDAGTNPRLNMNSGDSNSSPRASLPLTMTKFVVDESVASEISRILLQAGASSLALEPYSKCTVFEDIVREGKVRLVSSLLQFDPNAKRAILFPLLFPSRPYGSLVCAIESGGYAMTVLLLAHGAEVTITEAELSRAQSTTQGGPISLSACSPILQTAAARYNDVAALLIRVGADINDGSHPRGSYSNNQTILDFVRGTGGNRLALPSSQAQPSVVSPPNSVPQSGRQPQPDSVWREQYGRLENALKLVDNARNTLKQLDPRQQPDARGYLSELEQLLVIQGAKTSSELRSPFTAAPGQFNHAQPQPANPFLHMQLLQAAQAPQPAAPQPSAPQLLAPQPPAPPAPIPHATFPHTQLTQALPAQGLFPQAPFAYPAFPYLRSGWMGYNNLPPPHSHGFRLIGNDAIHDYTNSWIVPCEDDVPRYSRLFDACFTGDDLTVVELCCTPNNAGAVPLQIAAAHLHDYMRISNLGYSTLYVAILGRQWGTARLIMDVAAEQYERSAERRAVTPNFGSNIESNDWPDTPDAESDVSADANNTDERPDKNAGPVPSTLKISVSPRTLLYETLANIITSGKRIIAVNVLAKAILDNDVEAFKHIADLYNAPSLPLGTTALESILERDCPEMLDVYLKLTGVGINLVDGKQDNTKEDRFVGGEKPYCGLTVHGTKRKMLTRMEARNPYNRKASSDTPLVWKAASSGALKVLEYLFGEQVLSAYQSYATANYGGANDETKNAVDLRAALQEWLGWEVTELNESPIMAALVNKDQKCILPTLEKLYALSPSLMDSAINQPLYYSGHNSLLLAVHLSCGTDVIDFLLARGASYMERHRVEGWNVMHLACLTGNGRLLKHLMNKLPEDCVNSLLLQRSKDELETPLHAAVRSYEDDCVAILAAHGGPGLLARDIHGHMPLHSAAHRGYVAIVRTLVDVLPDEALHAEDGFGETPLEISTRQALLFRTRQHSPQYLAHPIPTSRLSPSSSPPSLSERQAAVSSLTAIVDELVRDGHLDPAAKPGTEILAFADEMKAKLALLESRPRADASAEGGDGGEHPYSTVIRVGYAAGTLDVVSRAVEARPASRTLVPMRDAMQSVQGTVRYSSRLVARAAEGWAYGPAPRDPGPLVAGLEAKSDKDDPRAKWEAGMVGTRLELSRNLGTGPLTFRYVSRTGF